jgi:hypothetical protein
MAFTGVLGSDCSQLGNIELAEEVCPTPEEEPARQVFVFPYVEGGSELPMAPMVGEEFAGSLPADEAPGAVGAIVEQASLAVSIGEDFAGSLPGEEVSTAAAVVEFVSVTLGAPLVAAEDFAGSVPFDELAAFVFVPLTIEIPTGVIVLGEDFAGSLPLEEPAGFVAAPLLDQAGSIAPASEDFAGSLPLEEPAVAVLLMPVEVFSSFSLDEEFGGAHPTEELASSPTTVIVPEFWVAGLVTPEDFAGSLPLEEPAGAVTAGTMDLAAAAVLFPLDEEFGGAHPTEEAAPVVFLELGTVPITIAIGEDFAGSLPLEEPPAAVSFFEESILIAQGARDEEFAGSLPLEEPCMFFGSAEDVARVTTFAIGEEFAGSLPLEETAGRWINVRVEASGLGIYDPSEYLPRPPGPSFLLSLTGADECDDYFFKDCPEEVAWELRIGDFGRQVTFDQFERKILTRQKDEASLAAFHQMIAVFRDEERARIELLKTQVKKAITIVGVGYVVWKVLLWL